MSADLVAKLDGILESGRDADDVLRGVVSSLAAEPAIAWAGIFFLDDGALVLGPEAGTQDPASRVVAPVSYQHAPVGELAADGAVEVALLEHVAARIATHVLLGWDTGGESWDP
jgi:hypothetical protein